MDPHRLSRLGEPDADMLRFTASTETDLWFAMDDLDVSRAHVIALHEACHIDDGEAAELILTLDKVGEMMPLSLEGHEDVHMTVEAAVTEIAGIETAGKLHTGRSRNDQVATDIRMATRREILGVAKETSSLVGVLINRAKEHLDSVMPGYTHMQSAQPVTLGFHLAAHAEAFLRDVRRMVSSFDLTNNCPLGSAAFAGTGFVIDRKLEARLLGFSAPIRNGMDAVSTRDFVVQCIADLVNLQNNHGRLASELVLWTTQEYNFATLPDEWASTSSIMPQKKNPDVLELVRARGGAVLGHFTAVASILSGLPYSYNRDLQQVTVHLHGALRGTLECCGVMVPVAEGVQFNIDEMERRATQGFSCATELADSLVRRTGISFREAHQVVGQMIKDIGEPESKISIKELDDASSMVIGKKASKLGFTTGDLKAALNPRHAIEIRSNLGGTSPAAVKKSIDTLVMELGNIRSELIRREELLEEGRRELLEYCRKITGKVGKK